MSIQGNSDVPHQFETESTEISEAPVKRLNSYYKNLDEGFKKMFNEDNLKRYIMETQSEDILFHTAYSLMRLEKDAKIEYLQGLRDKYLFIHQDRTLPAFHGDKFSDDDVIAVKIDFGEQKYASSLTTLKITNGFIGGSEEQQNIFLEHIRGVGGGEEIKFNGYLIQQLDKKGGAITKVTSIGIDASKRSEIDSAEILIEIELSEKEQGFQTAVDSILGEGAGPIIKIEPYIEIMDITDEDLENIKRTQVLNVEISKHILNIIEYINNYIETKLQ